MVEAARSDGFELFRIPGVLWMENGRILLYYECRKTESDWSESEIGMKISDDGAKSFSERKTIASFCGDTVNNPVMLEKDGRVHFFYCRNYSAVYYCFSDNYGETFSEERDITEQIKSGMREEFTVIALGPGHGIALKSGKMFVPVWTAYNPRDPKAHHPSKITALVSDNDGKNFRLLYSFITGSIPDPNEYSAVQTDDGKVFLSVRNESSQRFRAVSTGDGEKFSALKLHSGLSDPVCMSGAVYADGKIYLSGCADRSERKNLTVRMSDDNGKTSNDIILIENDASYSDIAYDKKTGRFLVIYESDECGYLKAAVIE